MIWTNRTSRVFFLIICFFSVSRSNAEDRDSLVQAKILRTAETIKSLQIRNGLLAKEGNWEDLDFLVDEFKVGDKDYIKVETKEAIRRRLAIFNRITGIQYYILITPGVPYIVYDTEGYATSKDDKGLVPITKEEREKRNADLEKAAQAVTSQEAITYTKAVFDLAKLTGKNGVSNGVLLVFYKQSFFGVKGGEVKNYRMSIPCLGDYFLGKSETIENEYKTARKACNAASSGASDLWVRFMGYSMMKSLFDFAFQYRNTDAFSSNPIANSPKMENFFLKTTNDILGLQEVKPENESLNAFENHIIFQEGQESEIKVDVKAYPYSLEIVPNGYYADFNIFGRLWINSTAKEGEGLMPHRILNLHITKLDYSDLDKTKISKKLKFGAFIDAYQLLQKVFDEPYKKKEVVGPFLDVWFFDPDGSSLKSLSDSYNEAYNRKNYKELNVHYFYMSIRDRLVDADIKKTDGSTNAFSLYYFRVIPPYLSQHKAILESGYNIEEDINWIPIRLNSIVEGSYFAAYGLYAQKTLDRIYADNVAQPAILSKEHKSTLMKTAIEEFVKGVRGKIDSDIYSHVSRLSDDFISLKKINATQDPEKWLINAIIDDRDYWLLDETAIPGNNALKALPCITCTTRSDAVCQAFDRVYSRAGSTPTAKTAIDKICMAVKDDNILLGIAQELLTIPNFDADKLNAFFADVNVTNTNGEELGNNLIHLDVGTVQAWLLMYEARGNGVNVPLRRDFQVLVAAKNIIIQNPPINLGTGLWRSVLINMIRSNRRTPCYTCGNAGAPHLNKMDAYLENIQYFADFHNKAGYQTVVNQLTSNATYFSVEPATFVLRVMDDEGWTVADFEQNIVGCVPDLRLVDGTICEFKSWSTRDNEAAEDIDEEQEQGYDGSKSCFWNFERGYTGYAQFLCYLRNIDNLSKLHYYFDERKIKDKPDKLLYVKEQFQKLLTNKQDEIFNTIWNNNTGANGGLRGSLFPETVGLNENDLRNIRPSILLKFQNIIANTTNSFYDFIKVK